MKEMWNQRYAIDEYYYGKLPNAYFQEKIESLVPGTLLLPAEGEGRNAVFAASHGWDVTAVDYSEEGRRKAILLAEESNVLIKYFLADLVNYDLGDELYDVIALIYLHMPPDFRKKIHRNVIKSLKPGGHLILEAFHKNQLRNSSGGPKSPDMLYSIELLKDDFNDLEMLQIEELTIHVEAGNGHGGEADLVRMFSEKKAHG